MAAVEPFIQKKTKKPVKLFHHVDTRIWVENVFLIHMRIIVDRYFHVVDGNKLRFNEYGALPLFRLQLLALET